MSLNERLIGVGAAACTTDSVQAFGADAAFSSNIALYQLDGDGGVTNNVPDTTGNYNGTATNVTYGTGVFGQAGVFNGSSSGITVNSFASLSQLGLSMWVNIADITSNYALAARYGTNREFAIYNYQASNGFIASIYYNGSNGNAITITAGDYLTNNTWHHIAFTSDGSTAPKLYIDGVERGTAQFSDAARCAYYTSSEPLEIGKGVSRFLNGSIDQVRIFDKAISAEDVATLYAETTSTASNTNPLSDGSGVALYTMDYDASDAGGLYDGTPTNVEFGVEGQINYGAGFNGSTSKIDVGNQSWFDSDFTLSMWFYPQNTSGTSFEVLTYKRGLSDFTMPFGLGLYEPNHGTFPQKTLFAMGGGGSTATYIAATNDYNVNSWNFVAVKISGTAMSITLNGTETTSTFTGTRQTNTETIRFGNKYSVDGDYPFEGNLDQIRIFNKALSSSEISTLYTETACVYTCTTDTVDYPTTNVAYYKLDNSAEDETGIYDGTATNINYTFGRFGQAAVFNGSSSYIETSNLIGTNLQFSASFWVNGTDMNKNSSDPSLIETFFYNRNPYVVINQYGGNWEYTIKNSSSSNTTIAYATSNFNDNQWYHFVITCSGLGGAMNFYINGVNVGTNTAPTSTINVASTGFIGAGGATSQNFDGKIDQVRFFSSALTSTQVTELYEEYECEDTSTFNPVLYTGNGSTQYISNVGFEPDLVWIKARSVNYDHQLHDIVRGAGNGILSNNTSAEFPYNTVTSFDANGFTVDASTYIGTNANNQTFVAWCWKAGGDSVLNEVGDINSQVSVNTDAGFSIVKWTGNNLASQTIGHGLSSTPEITIIKKLTGTALDWQVNLNSSITGTEGYFNLNLTVALYTTFPNYYTSANSTVLSTNGTTTAERQYNNQSADYIAYCFHSVSGYSKIGSYSGSNSPITIYTTDDGTAGGSNPFEPAFIMTKRTNSPGGYWIIQDNKRRTTNGNALFPNSSAVESLNWNTSFNSNGFTISSNEAWISVSGGEYIYMAFA